MRVLITGADGFVARNLRVRLGELGIHDVDRITRSSGASALTEAARRAEFVFHLAGVNRPQNQAEFETGNAGLTEQLCAALRAAGNRAPIVFSSSTQAALDNPYGRSKRRAEEILEAHGAATGAPVHVLRLTNVFGKWSRPNYNSAVATFCHQIARGNPITINNPDAPLRLVYIDDVVETFVALLRAPEAGPREVTPVYETTVGALAETLSQFAASRKTLLLGGVGTGLTRALYSTYVTHLPVEEFVYEVPRHADPRGEFVEMLKTPDSGQFSYFTAKPGVARGEHYHHSKTEKFLVLRGSAKFGFRHIETNQSHELVTHGGEGRIVETIPGWTHNIVNIGSEELLVMLWANEVFDRARPDTVPMKVAP